MTVANVFQIKILVFTELTSNQILMYSGSIGILFRQALNRIIIEFE